MEIVTLSSATARSSSPPLTSNGHATDMSALPPTGATTTTALNDTAAAPATPTPTPLSFHFSSMPRPPPSTHAYLMMSDSQADREQKKCTFIFVNALQIQFGRGKAALGEEIPDSAPSTGFLTHPSPSSPIIRLSFGDRRSVSRVHMLIRWNESAQVWQAIAVGKNGFRFNGQRYLPVEMGAAESGGANPTATAAGGSTPSDSTIAPSIASLPSHHSSLFRIGVGSEAVMFYFCPALPGQARQRKEGGDGGKKSVEKEREKESEAPKRKRKKEDTEAKPTLGKDKVKEESKKKRQPTDASRQKMKKKGDEDASTEDSHEQSMKKKRRRKSDGIVTKSSRKNNGDSSASS